jgi:hypothetical protein
MGQGFSVGRGESRGDQGYIARRIETQAQLDNDWLNKRKCQGQARNYRGQHPGPSDVVLVVEVADSGRADDRELGTEVYAPAGCRFSSS